MSVTDQGGWGEVERKAKLHELQEAVKKAELEAQAQGGGRGFAKAADYRAMEARRNLDQFERFSAISLVTITTEDRLRGAVVEALSQLEQGHPTAAHQVLQDALKIGGVK